MLTSLPTASASVNAHVPEDDKLCAGCAQSVSSESGGVVVAFGNSLWHVDWCVFSNYDSSVRIITSVCS